MLGHDKRVLVIGAHPDDEDTELLTVLVRGMGAEAAYLSLNRGEGGQNLIGPELGEALGLIRTEELLAARRLDGARQYFTRAYDFGYSKTLDETWQHWPRDTILKDVVRIVRRFRPQVIVSVFSGTPRDGHGQHQAAGGRRGRRSRSRAIRPASPSWRREEGLQPWTPLKLYRSARFDTAATTLVLDGGALDPAVGQVLSPDRDGRPESASLAGHGAAADDRAVPGAARAAGGAGEGRHHRPLRRGGHHPRRHAPARGRKSSNGHDARRRFAARVDSARALLHPGGLRTVAAVLRRAERDLYPEGDDGRAHLLFSTIEQNDQRRHLERSLALASGLVLDAL